MFWPFCDLIKVGVLFLFRHGCSSLDFVTEWPCLMFMVCVCSSVSLHGAEGNHSVISSDMYRCFILLI